MMVVPHVLPRMCKSPDVVGTQVAGFHVQWWERETPDGPQGPMAPMLAHALLSQTSTVTPTPPGRSLSDRPNFALETLCGLVVSPWSLQAILEPLWADPCASVRGGLSLCALW